MSTPKTASPTEFGVVGVDYRVKHIAIKPDPNRANLLSACGRYALRLARLPHHLLLPTCKRCTSENAASPPTEEAP